MILSEKNTHNTKEIGPWLPGDRYLNGGVALRSIRNYRWWSSPWTRGGLGGDALDNSISGSFPEAI